MRIDLVTTTQGIMDVYMRGPPSCLTEPAERYRTGGVHPLLAIPDQDQLGVAYVTQRGRIVSRVLLQMERMLHHFPYTLRRNEYARQRLLDYLKNAGFNFAHGPEWFGTRLNRMHMGTNFICPGLDPPLHFVWDDGKNLRFGFPLSVDDQAACHGLYSMSHGDGLAYPFYVPKK